MPSFRSETGQVAPAVVAVVCVLSLAAAALAGLTRASLAQARAAGVADAAALAGARVLLERAGDLLPRHDPRLRRTLPPLLTRAGLARLAADAARSSAAEHGAALVTVRVDPAPTGAPPTSLGVTVRLRRDRLPAWLGGERRRALATAQARAGAEPAAARAVAGAPRPADLAGFGGAAAVVAAAEAQLGWPYVWGGESRAEGGFDCSGLVAYALAAAGYDAGRPTADGFQRLVRPVPVDAGALWPGDLVFVGRPAYHVGLYAGGGIVIEAPHRGAVVRREPLTAGGWTGAGRLPALAEAGATWSAGVAPAAVPDWVPAAFRGPLAAAALREDLPATLLAAQVEAESGFDPTAVSFAGAQGPAQFMPATWAGAWNPHRERSPFEIGPALLAQARYLRTLLDRAGGDVPRALAAYNAGWAGSEGAWPDETRAYVARIMRRFGGAAALAATGRGAAGGLGVRLLPIERRSGSLYGV